MNRPKKRRTFSPCCEPLIEAIEHELADGTFQAIKPAELPDAGRGWHRREWKGLWITRREKWRQVSLG